MSILQELLIFWTLFFATECYTSKHYPTTNEARIKRDGYCHESVEFYNCKNGEKSIYRNENLKIIATFKGCHKKYIYDFKLVNQLNTGASKEYPNNPTGATLIVDKFSLKGGTYRVVLNVHSEKKASVFIDNCILVVKVSPPVPFILGGFQRHVGIGHDLVFNASKSLDFNSPYPTSEKNFEYSWIYDCDDCNGFQTAPDKGPIFKLPGNTLNKETKYLVKLGVRTKWWNETIHAQQLVYIRNNTPGIELDCEDPCHPAFTLNEMKVVTKCTYLCPQEINLVWKAYKVPKNDEDVIAGSANWEEFSLKSASVVGDTITLVEGYYEGDKGFLITVSMNEFNYSASFKFVTPLYHDDFKCRLLPNFGIVLETKFKVECKGSSFPTYFWTTVGDGAENEQVLEYDSSWEYLSFTIPRIGPVYLHYSDYNGIESSMKYNPKLVELETDAGVIEDLYTKGNESVKNLLDSGDFGGAMDKMNLVSKSIAKMNEAEYQKVEGTVKQIIHDLNKFPLKDIARVEQATDIIAALTSVKNVTINTDFSEEITRLCRKLARKYKKMIDHEFLGGKTGDMPIHTTVGHIMDCMASANRPNLEAIEDKIVDINMTTPYYIVEEGNLNTEVYEEYKDESKALENIGKYINNTRRLVEVCNLSGRSLLKRIVGMQVAKTDSVKTDLYTVMVVKMPGYEIVQDPYQVLGVKLTFSKDLVDSELMHILIMCVTSENLFWWQDAVDIVSDILIVSLRIKGRVSDKYEKPFEIIFALKRMPKLRHMSMESSVRMRHLLRDPEHSGEEQLAIFIILVEAGCSLVVHFRDTDPEIKLNVISTTFKLPILTDFKGNMQIVQEQDNFFADEDVYDYDTIRLLAVIPSPPNESRKNESFNFKMDAFAVTCMKWMEEGHWVPGCKAGFRNSKAITCYCTSLSTITSTVRNIPIKEWKDYIPMPVYLEEEYFYGVCIVIAVIFFLYCVAICFTVCEEDHTLKAIYFLSDVVRDNRYGYLIVVETSFKLGSGTTSNVVIKLKGAKSESEPHVLNYPDPLMVMLQRRNEDWFLLATKNNLGKLKEIELWIDGVGSSPTWNCSCIEIFDLQYRCWYNFRISKCFTIYPEPKIHLKSYPIDEKRDRTSTRVIINIFKKCLPTFKVFNLSLKRKDESLSYVKRLTMMLSILTSIAMWCIVINGVPKRNASDIIMKDCAFTIKPSLLTHGIGGSITTAIYHMPIKYFFMTSRVQIPYHTASQKSKKPLIFTLLCWILIITIITINLTFIAVYGVWMPHVTAMMWAAETTLGMLFYIFFMDVLYSSIDKLINGSKDMENYVKRLFVVIYNDIEKQRLILYRVFGKFLLRPFLTHLYTPLHGVALRILWHAEKTKYEVRELVESLFMFIIYISLMYMVILANRDYRNVYSNLQVKKIIEGHATKSFPFEEVFSVKTLHEYLEETLVEATQSHTWYGTYAVREPGMTVDYNNKLIGVVRLRQHRAEPNSCELPELMQFFNYTCVADYFRSKSEKTYGEGWNLTRPPLRDGRMKNVWRYTPQNQTGTTTFIGKLGVYGGGGYIAFLGRGMKNSLVNLKYLHDNDWFDRQTRSLFIEFLLYNANFNIFNAVTYTIEKSALGYLKKEVKVETSKMLLKHDESIIAIPILLGLFLLLVVVFSVRTLLRIKTTRIWYFRDLWHLVDIVLILLSMTCVSMFYRRSKEVGKLLDSLEGKDQKEFVNYFSLLRIDNTFTVVSAILITVASIKLWGLLRFIIIFKVVERTFKTCFIPLCGLFLYHGIVLLAFSCLGFLLFVDHSYRFEGYFNTLEFLLQLNLRPFEGEEINMLVEPKLGLGYVFYVSYAITVTFFNCVYTALIIIYYSKAQEYYSNHTEIYSVWEHLKDQFRFYYNFFRVRLKGLRLSGGHEKHSIPVSPKSNETRYADSFKLDVDKLRAMSLISLCVIRNSDPKRKPLTQRDIRIMTYALYYLQKLKHKSEHDEEVERFYKGKMGQNKVKLIHENVLKKVEAATSVVLGRSLQETLKEMNVNRDGILMEENTRQITRMKENLSTMLETVKRINIRVVPPL